MKKLLRSQVVWFFFIALTIRLILFFSISNIQPQKFELRDLDGYVNIARNILDFGNYSRDTTPPFIADITRPPIYPTMLVGLLHLGQFSGNLIVLFNIVLSACLVGMTFLISQELKFSPKSAFIAALLVGLDPILILVDHYPLSEPLFLFIWIFGFWIFIKYLHSDRIFYLVGSGILFALAALTRPVLQFFPAIAIPVLLIAKNQPWSHKIRNSLIFFSVFIALLLPWTIRNKIAGDVFTLSSIAEINLYYYRANAVLAEGENIPHATAQNQLYDELNQAKVEGQLSPGQVYDYMRSRAIGIFLHYPIQTLKMTALGAARLLLDPGYSLICAALDPSNLTPECFPGEATMLGGSILSKMWSRYQTMHTIQQLTLVWSIFLMTGTYLGGFLGLILLARHNKWAEFSIFLGSILYFIMLSSGAESLYRLRVPIIPLLAILTGFYLSKFVNNKTENNNDIDKLQSSL